MIKTFQRVTAIVAVVLWIAVILVFAIAIAKHQFWSLAPIIAHNRPQNYVGWMVTIAFVCSIISPILRLIEGK